MEARLDQVGTIRQIAQRLPHAGMIATHQPHPPEQDENLLVFGRIGANIRLRKRLDDRLEVARQQRVAAAEQVVPRIGGVDQGLNDLGAMLRPDARKARRRGRMRRECLDLQFDLVEGGCICAGHVGDAGR